MSWLDEIKPGQMVLVSARALSLRKVDRVTPTQIVVDTSRFRRSTGRMIGDRGPWAMLVELVERTPENDRRYFDQRDQTRWMRLCRTTSDALLAARNTTRREDVELILHQLLSALESQPALAAGSSSGISGVTAEPTETER